MPLNPGLRPAFFVVLQETLDKSQPSWMQSRRNVGRRDYYQAAEALYLVVGNPDCTICAAYRVVLSELAGAPFDKTFVVNTL